MKDISARIYENNNNTRNENLDWIIKNLGWIVSGVYDNPYCTRKTYEFVGCCPCAGINEKDAIDNWLNSMKSVLNKDDIVEIVAFPNCESGHAKCKKWDEKMRKQYKIK